MKMNFDLEDMEKMYFDEIDIDIPGYKKEIITAEKISEVEINADCYVEGMDNCVEYFTELDIEYIDNFADEHEYYEIVNPTEETIRESMNVFPDVISVTLSRIYRVWENSYPTDWIDDMKVKYTPFQ